MTIEAPLSKYKRTNFKIYIGFCLIVSAWFAYDGYLSRSFYNKHVKDGIADDSMKFNRSAPIFLVGLAAVLGWRFHCLVNKKVIAGEDGLILSNGKKISYDSIEKIDKTDFSAKGFFELTYKDSNNNETAVRISRKDFDNLDAVLEHLIAKIS
ncbi:MAG: hypothetical protein JXB29_00760 [Sedimentisphaerales bacterium]|nr:hypothetical protein [Sedimentisphaerales bacterium]